MVTRSLETGPHTRPMLYYSECSTRLSIGEIASGKVVAHKGAWCDEDNCVHPGDCRGRVQLGQRKIRIPKSHKHKVIKTRRVPCFSVEVVGASQLHIQNRRAQTTTVTETEALEIHPSSERLFTCVFFVSKSS